MICRYCLPNRDISNGREAYPIKVLKRLPTDGGRSASYTKTMNSVPQFQYITQSIVLHDLRLQIDRRISQMRICECIDRYGILRAPAPTRTPEQTINPITQHCSCTSASCRCSQISVQNWYNAEGRLNGNFDFTDPAMIFECSDVCGCNKLLCRNRVVQRGQTVALQLVECGGRKGWGVTAVGDVARGTFVAEYCGELLSGAEAAGRSNAEYMFETQDDSQVSHSATALVRHMRMKMYCELCLHFAYSTALTPVGMATSVASSTTHANRTCCRFACIATIRTCASRKSRSSPCATSERTKRLRTNDIELGFYRRRLIVYTPNSVL